jgi:hypothetical protein
MIRPSRKKQRYVAQEFEVARGTDSTPSPEPAALVWQSEASNVAGLLKELAARGWHPTDILDAVDAARRTHRHGA